MNIGEKFEDLLYPGRKSGQDLTKPENGQRLLTKKYFNKKPNKKSKKMGRKYEKKKSTKST